MPANPLPVYVSYAWGGASDALVDAFQQRLPAKFRLVRDKYSMQSGDWIDDFMRDIGRAELVLVVISEKYLKSTYCMRELLHLHDRSLGERSDFMARIVPLIVGDLSFSRARNRAPYVEYWEGEHAELGALLKRRGLDTVGTADRNELLAIEDFKQKVSDLLFWLDSALMPRGAHVQSDGIDAAIALFEKRVGDLGSDETFSRAGAAGAAHAATPEPAGTGPRREDQAESGKSGAVRDFHKEKVVERLDAAGAAPFRQALQARLVEKHLVADSVTVNSAAKLVDFVADCPAHSVQALFWAIRWAFEEATKAADPAGRSAAERAAVALYCQAACRAVERVEAIAGHVFKVRHAELLIYAVIAAALEKRPLHLDPTQDDPTVPRPSYVFPVHVSAAGDRMVDAFERAAYLAVVPGASNKRGATEDSLDVAPLSKAERAALEAELDDIAEVKECSRALVVHGLLSPEPCRDFAERNRVPTLLPDTDAPNSWAD